MSFVQPRQCLKKLEHPYAKRKTTVQLKSQEQFEKQNTIADLGFTIS